MSGLSGLTKAYVSVLSASGLAAVSGASRWLEAELVRGASRALPPARVARLATPASTFVRRAERFGRVIRCSFL